MYVNTDEVHQGSILASSGQGLLLLKHEFENVIL